MQLSDLEVPEIPTFDDPEWDGGEAAAVVPFRRPRPSAKPAAKADPIARAITPARRPKAKPAADAELADVLLEAIRAVRRRRGRVTQAARAREMALLDVLRELIGGVK